MKAIELRIVFEDEDGNTYVRTYGLNDPHRWLGKFMDGLEAADGEYFSLPEAETVGPVLRKVTEVEGAVEHDGDAWFVVDGGNGPGVGVQDIVPEQVPLAEGPRPYRTFRFRIDVTAVPVKP